MVEEGAHLVQDVRVEVMIKHLVEALIPPIVYLGKSGQLSLTRLKK
jgi:hypothetical protein